MSDATRVTVSETESTVIEFGVVSTTISFAGEVGPMGPQGPTGPTGPAPEIQQAYRHVQSVPSSIWLIEHNLGYRPAGVLVIDSGGSIVEGSVEENDETTTILSFESGFSGTADLS